MSVPARLPQLENWKAQVIGAGPAGLSAAHDLALLGYSVTVFEAADEPGGMMRFGIPEYRLPRTLIRSEIDKILSLGVTLKTATPLALVVWFGAVVLFDLAALGLASLLRSGTASRVLIASVLINPVDCARTAMLLAIEGPSAFGAASLALLRFTRGPSGAALMLAASMLLWLVGPVVLAARRLRNTDI